MWGKNVRYCSLNTVGIFFKIRKVNENVKINNIGMNSTTKNMSAKLENM